MELNREHFRANIFYNCRCERTQQQFDELNSILILIKFLAMKLQCIDELNSIFAYEAPSRTSAYRWYGEFNRGRSSLQDDYSECSLKSVIVSETIDVVRQLILHDRHVTYCEIETTLGISGTSIVNRSKKNNQLEWQKCFDNWFKRMQKCIDLNGEYFEKQ